MILIFSSCFLTLHFPSSHVGVFCSLSSFLPAICFVILFTQQLPSSHLFCYSVHSAASFQPSVLLFCSLCSFKLVSILQFCDFISSICFACYSVLPCCNLWGRFIPKTTGKLLASSWNNDVAVSSSSPHPLKSNDPPYFATRLFKQRLYCSRSLNKDSSDKFIRLMHYYERSLNTNSPSSGKEC